MKPIAILLLVFLSASARAQTWDEFFKQKETQKKYLLQQLAGLQIFAGVLNDGYKIANQGITSIKGFTKGEFDLHQDFFNALALINPNIADKRKIADIMAWQIEISKGFRSLRNKNLLSDYDKGYFEEVRLNVIKECGQDLNHMLVILSSGKLDLKDDERMMRLEGIYQSMRDKYMFTQSFLNQVRLLNFQKTQEQRSNQLSRELYNIQN